MNSFVLVIAIHRRLGRASDGTSTQVVVCIINKLKAMISKMIFQGWGSKKPREKIL